MEGGAETRDFGLPQGARLPVEVVLDRGEVLHGEARYSSRGCLLAIPAYLEKRVRGEPGIIDDKFILTSNDFSSLVAGATIRVSIDGGPAAVRARRDGNDVVVPLILPPPQRSADSPEEERAGRVLSLERQLAECFIGQHAARRMIAWGFAEWQSGRVPSSVLIYGPTGMGKTYAGHGVAGIVGLPVFEPGSTLSTRWYRERLLDDNVQALRSQHPGDVWVQVESEMFAGSSAEWARGILRLREELTRDAGASPHRRVLVVTKTDEGMVQRACVGGPHDQDSIAEQLSWEDGHIVPEVRQLMRGFDLYVPFFALSNAEQVNATIELLESRLRERGVRVTVSAAVREWLLPRMYTLFQVEREVESLERLVVEAYAEDLRDDRQRTMLDIAFDDGRPAVFQIEGTERLGGRYF